MELVYNIHQLKAGGKTLEGILAKQYGIDAVCFISKLPPKTEKFISRDYGQKLHRIPKKDLSSIKIITGHMFYGIHENIQRDHTYITMLRDPISRLHSYYYYLLDSDDMNLSHVIKTKNISLEEFVSLDSEGIKRYGFEQHAAFELSHMLENGQCKFISGLYPPLGFSDSSLFDCANNNLKDKFIAVGFTEYFDESLLLYKKKLNWPKPIYYAKKNVTKNKKRDSQTNNMEINDIIKKRNKYDMQLYENALSRFKEEIEKEIENINLKKKIITTRSNVYTRLIRLYKTLKKK